MEEDQSTKRVKKTASKRGTRGVKACEYCKRLKARCIPSPVAGKVKCLRCDSLKRHCSFEDLFAGSSLPLNGQSDMFGGSVNENEHDAAHSELLKSLIKLGPVSPGVLNLNLRYTKTIHENLLKVLSILENTTRIDNNIQQVQRIVNAGAIQQETSAGKNMIASLENRETGVDATLIDAVDMITGSISKPENNGDEVGSGKINKSIDTSPRNHSLADQNTAYLSSSYTLMSQLVPKDHLPLLIRKLHDNSFTEIERTLNEDIVTMNTITLEESYMLMQSFRNRYSDWCSFPKSASTEKLVSNIRSKNCTLLLTVACTLALRYTDDYHDLKTRCYKNLLLKLRSDLESSLCYVPQTKEFLQAIVILSLYASSFSSDFLCVDAWYLSGLGTQHLLTTGVAGSLLNRKKGGNDVLASAMNLLDPVMQSNFGNMNNSVFEETEQFEQLSTCRLWNHLCLCHLNCCIASGRMCTIDDRRLDMCKVTLDLPHSTNFDGRMVAEIELSRIVYKFIQSLEFIDTSSRQPLDDVIKKLLNWLDNWKYLFAQPITQFVEFNYHYALCIVHYSWYHKLYSSSLNQDSPLPSFLPSSGGSKTEVAHYLNQAYPLKKVVRSIPQAQLNIILDHAHKGLTSIVNCPFDKFKFLSDHLVFSGVHLALICLLLLHEDYTLSKSVDIIPILSDVKKLSQRLQKIREGELKSFWVEEVDLRIPSVILQYHKAIEGYLLDKFSAFDIQIDPNYI
ncbi:GAL4 superfamily protein [Kluyveromyces marxianus]